MNKHHGASRWDAAALDPRQRALLLTALAWNMGWKGASMWRAARNGSKPWFATLLLTNTLGVLDAFYLFVVTRRRVG